MSLNPRTCRILLSSVKKFQSNPTVQLQSQRFFALQRPRDRNKPSTSKSSQNLPKPIQTPENTPLPYANKMPSHLEQAVPVQSQSIGKALMTNVLTGFGVAVGFSIVFALFR